MTRSNRIKQTRAKLAWYGCLALTGVAVLAILKGMEGVASAAVGGILTIVIGYQASEGYTKGKYIDKNQKSEE